MGTWFAAAAPQAPFKVGAFAIPSADGGTSIIPTTTGGGLSVSATSKYPEAAIQFAIEFSLDAENLTAGLRADAVFPAVKGYHIPSDVDPVLKESYEIFASPDSEAVPAFAWANDSLALLPTGWTDELNKSAQSLILGQSSVLDEVKRLDEKWDELAAG